jgi:hypothetical protein
MGHGRGWGWVRVRSRANVGVEVGTRKHIGRRVFEREIGFNLFV